MIVDKKKKMVEKKLKAAKILKAQEQIEKILSRKSVIELKISRREARIKEHKFQINVNNNNIRYLKSSLTRLDREFLDSIKKLARGFGMAKKAKVRKAGFVGGFGRALQTLE